MSRRRSGFRRAFTITEVMVASAVSSMVLLAVTSILRHTAFVEERVSVRLLDRAAAQAVADHMAVVLEHLNRLPRMPRASQARDPAEGCQVLTCAVGGSDSLGADPACRSLHARRYCWDFPSEDPRAGALVLQVRPFAGTKALSGSPGVEEQPASAWGQISRQVVGRDIRKLQVEFRRINSRPSVWRSEPGSGTGPLLCRVLVQVGKETVERVVVCPVTAAVLSGQEAAP